jgi:hypothetical protein
LYTVNRLAEELGHSEASLLRLASRIDTTGYRQFPDTSGKKTRIISVPSERLKGLQRDMLDTVFAAVRVSDRVYSQRGRDVIQNAQQHCSHAYMLCVDLRDCFPTTTLQMIRDALLRAGFAHDVTKLIARLVTYNGRLPQGPPTSPAVFNCVFHDADVRLECLATEFSAVYTRYMDDLCFSGNADLRLLRRRVVAVLRGYGYGISERKTRYSGPGQPHVVTKILVTSSLSPDACYLRELSRAIRTYGSSRRRENAASIMGQIRWVKRLDRPTGDRLERDFLRVLSASRLKPNRPSALLAS